MSNPRQTTLVAATERLADATSRLEAGFVGVGGHLTEAVERIAALRDVLAAVPDELSGDAVTQAGADLTRTAQAIGAMSGDLVRERAALTGLIEACAGLGKNVGRLGETMRQVAVLAVNARIVAASLSAEGADFTVFTTEIGRLALQARRNVAALAQAQRELAALLTAVRERHGAFADRHGAMLMDAEHRLIATLATVQAHQRAALEATHEITERSRQISDGLSRAVGGMQIGDITRQRIEHVSEALAAALAACDGGSTMVDPALHDAFAAEAARLQSAQLRLVLADFQAESGAVATALDGIAGQTAAMLALAEATYGGSGDSFLGDLAEQVRDAGTLLHACAEGRAEVDHAAGTLRVRLQEIGAQVGLIADLEADMRLLGLNTALRCGRLGNAGRVLNVVAQELRAFGRRTVEEAQAVMASLGRLGTETRALEALLASRNAAGIAAMQAETETAIRHFGTAATSLGHALDTVRLEGARVSASLGQAGCAIAQQEGIAASVDAALVTLSPLIAGAEVPHPDLPPGLVRQVLGDRYTMASERAVEDAFFARSVPRGGAPGRAEPQDVLEDILF